MIINFNGLTLCKLIVCIILHESLQYKLIPYNNKKQCLYVEYYLKENVIVMKILLSNSNENMEMLMLPLNQRLQYSVIPFSIAGSLINASTCCKLTLPETDMYRFSDIYEMIIHPHLQYHNITISNDINKKYLDTFGIAFPLHSTIYTFLYQMKVNGYINKLCYSIIPYNSTRESVSKGKICLGNCNKQYQHLYYDSCKVNSMLEEWNCKLTDVSFILIHNNITNIMNVLNEPVIQNVMYFNIHKEGINIPYDVFTMLKESELFSLLLYKDYCRTVLNAYFYNIICFDKNAFFPLIENSLLRFTFGRIEIEFHLTELFSCDKIGHVCNSLIYNDLHGNGNNWVFGSILISKVNALEFNEEEGVIRFYKDKWFYRSDITRKKDLLKLVLCILSLNIIGLLYTKWKINVS